MLYFIITWDAWVGQQNNTRLRTIWIQAPSSCFQLPVEIIEIIIRIIKFHAIVWNNGLYELNIVSISFLYLFRAFYSNETIRWLLCDSNRRHSHSQADRRGDPHCRAEIHTQLFSSKTTFLNFVKNKCLVIAGHEN